KSVHFYLAESVDFSLAVTAFFSLFNHVVPTFLVRLLFSKREQKNMSKQPLTHVFILSIYL
ncbi:MAG: hypothetical protein ABF629_12890, partial [Sporolactobacillus sp.]